MPKPATLRILHISDLHCGKETKSGAQWRSQRVLGDKWQTILAQIKSQYGKPDLICFTGDIAQSATTEQYALATTFFDELLAQLEMPREALYVVQGNHDIERDTHQETWKKVRDQAWAVQDSLPAWMANNRVPPGFDAAWREQMLVRQGNYQAWAKSYWPEREFIQSHPALGYRVELAFGGKPLHLVGLDSAWLAGDDKDVKELRLLDDQIARHLTDSEGKPLAGNKIVMLHHPLDEMADGKQSRTLLAEYGVQLVLHGHVHEANHQAWKHPNHANALQESVAGCLYESDSYPNCFQMIELALEDLQAQRLWLCSWSSEGHWYPDNSKYQGSRDGWRALTPSPTPSAPVHEASGRALYGRDVEMAQLQRAMFPASGTLGPAAICCVLEGMPGVGKTHLAQAFIERHWAAGRPLQNCYVRLYLHPSDEPASNSHAVLTDYAQMLGQRVAAMRRLNTNASNVFDLLAADLQMADCLLLIENVDSKPLAEVVVQLVRHLPYCPVLVTARYRNISQKWQKVQVDQLAREFAVELLRHEAPDCNSSDSDLLTLAKGLGFLPLALHIAASHLQIGYSPEVFLQSLLEDFNLPPEDLSDTAHSAQDATQRAKAILHSSFELSWASWCKQFSDDATMREGLAVLAHGPLQGCGAHLGAALVGIVEASEITDSLVLSAQKQWETLHINAKRWSLAQCEAGQLSFHPLLRDWLARENAQLQERCYTAWQAWLLARLPQKANTEQGLVGVAWKQLRQEQAALAEWLEHCIEQDSIEAARAVLKVSSGYAMYQGPFAMWQRFASSALAHLASDDVVRGSAYWILGQCAFRAGDIAQALAAAQEKQEFENERGSEYGAALAVGLQADIFLRQGMVEEALRIRREEEIPIYKKFGEKYAVAVTFGNIADILVHRGEMGEAERIWRDEVIPVFEKLGDVRSVAITRGKIADILAKRGNVEEAMRIWREEEIPVYKKFGDVRAVAFVRGNIAEILAQQGEFKEALRIRREEEIPVFEKLGDVPATAFSLAKIADILAQQGEFEESLRIRREEVIPLYEKLGDIRGLMAAYRCQASDLLRRAASGDAQAARQLLTLALASAKKIGLALEEELIKDTLAGLPEND